MRSFPAILASVLAAMTIAQAAPIRKNEGLDIPNEANGKVENYLSDEVLKDIANHTAKSKYGRAKLDKDSLAEDIRPVLGAVNPLAQGLDAGLQQGAGNVKAAVQNAGSALAQAANGVGDAASTVSGLGQTAGATPEAVQNLLHALDHSSGPLGSLLHAIFGR